MINEINVTIDNMAELTSNAFMDCLFKEGEDTTNCKLVQGIAYSFVFHPQRLEEKRELVTAILSELPVEFKDGCTFLKFYTTKNGEAWTDSYQVCEQLVAMAVGLDMMQYCFPREMWSCLPYVQIVNK